MTAPNPLAARRRMSQGFAETQAQDPARRWPNDESFMATLLNEGGFRCRGLNGMGRRLSTPETYREGAPMSHRRIAGMTPNGMVYHPVHVGERFLRKADSFVQMHEGRGISLARAEALAAGVSRAADSVVNAFVVRADGSIVCSLATVPALFAEGPESYNAMGVGRSRGTMPVQLAGNIRYGGLYEVPFGITLGELVLGVGGGTASGRPVRAVQVGGPLGAYFPPHLFDTPFDYEAFAAKDGLIGHGGITVFDDTVDMARMARFALEFCAVESCGKCSPCRIGAVRGQ